VGVTFSWAVLNFEGKVIDVSSSRVAKDMEKTLLGYGKPIIISTDVNRNVRKVKKIATNLGARYFRPDHDLGVHEKERLISGFKTNNRHERDSLASAINAHRFFKDLLRRAKRYGKNWELRAANVMLGKSHNLRQAGMRI
jgi:predicted RNase H-like nuclease (RuvC/YqgF family)